MNDIQQLLTAYDTAYLAQFGEKAPIVAGKDAKLAKELLSRYSLEQLTRWIIRFCASQDAFIRERGYTFGVFHLKIGSMIVSAKTATPRVEPTPEQVAHAQKIWAAKTAAEAQDRLPPPAKPARVYITREQHQEVLRQLAETKAKLFGRTM